MEVQGIPKIPQTSVWESVDSRGRGFSEGWRGMTTKV